MSARRACDLSVVIPVYNEEENIAELWRRLRESLDTTGADWEVVFVNDASRDKSLEMLRELHASNARVRIVSFARNFGHQMAITAGMRYAAGAAVVLMDGDLQDPPEVLPDLYRTLREGKWDVVYAVRRARKESLPVRVMYHVFYRVMQRLANIDIPLDSGDFCIIGRRALDQINAMPERNRFVRGLRSWVGFRQTGYEYERAARHAGSPKYTLRGLFKLAFDGIFSFSVVPLRLSLWLGVLTSLIGVLYAALVIVQRAMGAFATIPGWSTVVVAVLVMGGVQLVILGVLGEYLGRIYDETKGRPHFVVDETIGFAESITATTPATESA